MNVVKKKYFGFAIILLSFLVSCKKDDDGNGPEVKFNTPLENQTFNIYDPVTVNASVSDQTKLATVSISLEDAQGTPAYITIPVSVTSPSMTINEQYMLDNIHLESGLYYIVISASDGKHDTHARQKINVIAVPKVLKTIYVTSKTSSLQTNLSATDSAFTTILPFHVFTGDHIGSSVSSYYQQAYMCGNYTGNFSGLDIVTNNIKFNVTPIVSGSPYFTGFYSDDKTNYICRYDGFIKGYDRLGTSVYGANAIGGYYSEHICFSSGYLISEQQDKTSSAKMLVTYFPTSSFEKNCALTQDVVSFCEKDAADVFVFGNVAGQGVIQLFDRTNNNLWSPYPFPLATGSILSALRIDSDTYLIAHSNGTIYRYQYLSGSLTTYLTGYTAVQLKLDDITNQLYIVETNKVSVFDYSSATFIHSVTSSETILGINLLYNR
jgi:hypothetical protein